MASFKMGQYVSCLQTELGNTMLPLLMVYTFYPMYKICKHLPLVSRHRSKYIMNKRWTRV